MTVARATSDQGCLIRTCNINDVNHTTTSIVYIEISMKLYDRCCSCPTTMVRAKRLNATFKHLLCTCRFMFVLNANVNVAVNTICRFAQTSIVIKVIVPRGNRITALAGLPSYEIGKIATL